MPHYSTPSPHTQPRQLPLPHLLGVVVVVGEHDGAVGGAGSSAGHHLLGAPLSTEHEGNSQHRHGEE